MFMRYVYIVIYSFKWYCMVRFWFLAEVFSFDPYFLDSISRYRIACPILPYPIMNQSPRGEGLEAWVILYVQR